MKDSTYDKLFELSYRTEERFVTPLILEYYRFESLGLGISEEKIIKLIESKCNSILN